MGCIRTVIEILNGGFETTIQDYPGRVGYWYIGIPPSGPFDSVSFRLGNLLVGNSLGEAGLEIAMLGPRLRFSADAAIALTGANLSPMLNGAPLEMWKTLAVRAGDTLSFGLCREGCRAYLTVAGGIDVPVVLGSKSTYMKGLIGGLNGRKLEAGDALIVGKTSSPLKELSGREVRKKIIPHFSREWQIKVMLGPQDDYLEDDFLLETYVLGEYPWKVTMLLDRVGVRLGSLEHKWKSDRPPSGAHPSNINLVYCGLGIINILGDVPTIIGVDGISLTGYVSAATIIGAELWKVGQLKPNDIVRFKAVAVNEAQAARRSVDVSLNESCIIKI